MALPGKFPHLQGNATVVSDLQSNPSTARLQPISTFRGSSHHWWARNLT